MGVKGKLIGLSRTARSLGKVQLYTELKTGRRKNSPTANTGLWDSGMGVRTVLHQRTPGACQFKLPIIARCLHLGVAMPTDSWDLLAQVEKRRVKMRPVPQTLNISLDI